MSADHTIRLCPEHSVPFPRFWHGPGFSPGELLLTPEMQRTLTLLAGVPRQGIRYLRPHFMLNLVRAEKVATGHVYDWRLLDDALDVMIDRGFVPFFEIMGNPSDVFQDFASLDTLKAWRDLVSEMLGRYRTRYGAEALRDWYFETWNEPDLPWWSHGEQGFLNYYDACVAGVDAVDPSLTIGGPGTARTLSPMFRTFVAHCDRGTSALTGDGPPRVDFISVHEKGVQKTVEDVAPDSLGICDREMQAVRYLREHHPRLADLPLINNECDPQVGWWHIHTWRATAYAPAMIAKIIDQHQRLVADQGDAPFHLLFNDNGFMGTWGHRTHFTLFGEREFSKAQSEHITDLDLVAAEKGSERAFTLIKKPALTVMEMLAQLAESRITVEVDPPAAPDDGAPGVIATRHEDGTIACLLYHSRDAVRVSGMARIRLQLPLETARPVLVLGLDDLHDHPFSVWEALGAPAAPGPDGLARMHRAAEPVVLIDSAMLYPDRNGAADLSFDLPLPSVALVLVGGEEAPPAVPTEVAATTITGFGGAPECLVTWTGDDRPGTRYEVGIAANGGEPFRVLTERPVLASTATLPGQAARTRLGVRSVSLCGRRSVVASVPVTPSAPPLSSTRSNGR